MGPAPHWCAGLVPVPGSGPVLLPTGPPVTGQAAAVGGTGRCGCGGTTHSAQGGGCTQDFDSGHQRPHGSGCGR